MKTTLMTAVQEESEKRVADLLAGGRDRQDAHFVLAWMRRILREEATILRAASRVQKYLDGYGVV